ncbi:MAG TPA: CoA transferase [Candidatus Binataceae bacterium]
MGPLKGIRVLDLSMVVSGPFCTMMLADLGADVIKIEPPEGDVSRMDAGGVVRGGMHVGILNWNRNKRAMVLDLKRPGAAEVFLKMAEQSHVVVQNVRPGVVERLGVGYEAVSARNPKIVYCSIAGYGFSGPLTNKPAYDPIIQAHAGVMISQRTQGRPRAVKNIIADKVTAMTAAISILAALNEAHEGRGQHIKLAMIDAVAYYLMPDTATKHTYLPHKPGVPPTMGTAEPYQTADGFIAIAPLTDKHWAAILDAVGHPEWFAGDEPRPERVRRAARNLIALFPTRPSAYWLERIEAADVPCGPVNDYDSIWTDPQFTENETFLEYEHPNAGRVRAVRSPARFSETEPELYRHAPLLGEQTDDILRDFGFAAADISRMHADGIVK